MSLHRDGPFRWTQDIFQDGLPQFKLSDGPDAPSTAAYGKVSRPESGSCYPLDQEVG